MNRVASLALLSIVTLVLSVSLGWVSTTGIGTTTVEHLGVETPYVSGCCALIDDPLASVSFDLYQSSDTAVESHPVVITLQAPGVSPDTLAPLNIELARRNMAAISITLPENMDYSNMTWKGRQLSDVMAYLRDTIESVEYEYAVIADAKSASIAFSMNFLLKHPSAIVTVGYDSEWDQAARFYDGNLLMISSDENLEVLNIVEERDNLTCACIGLDYGDLSLGNASGSVILDSSKVNLQNQEVMESSIDWVLRTLHSDSYEEDNLDTVESISSAVVATGIVSDVLLGGGFLLGVIAIVEFRKRH
ncbi:MAG: hypothetical protein ACW98Y_07385 [Candidatus Thorarchaeota archaeon]